MSNWGRNIYEARQHLQVSLIDNKKTTQQAKDMNRQFTQKEKTQMPIKYGKDA